MAQEIVIAAGGTAWIFPANGRPRRINRATPRLGVEKAADTAKMLILLAAHGIGLVAINLGEFLTRLLEPQAEMVGQPLDVAFFEGDDRIRTTISRAF